jgi:VanZ family protein
MQLALRAVALVSMTAAACDQVGRENGRVDVVPVVAPPHVSPVEVRPPSIERSTVGRVRVTDPPSADAAQIDLYRQSSGVVDILWVIDDSGSMANERSRLVNNFSRFVQALKDLRVDFQMGVTAVTPADRGRLRGMPSIVDVNTPNAVALFEANTTFPAGRAQWEQGLRMAQFALSTLHAGPGGPNAGFVRPNAALAIVVVTNEDDASFGSPEYYARTFRSLKGPGNENLVTFNIIGGPVPNGCIAPDEAVFYGSRARASFRYTEVATRTGGIIGSICDPSFDQTLLRLAQQLNTLKRVFAMTLLPVTSSLRVTVIDGNTATTIPRDDVRGWQYRVETNSIAFLGPYVPPPGSTVRIDYAFVRP